MCLDDFIDQLYDRLIEHPRISSIIDVFKRFYGDDRVDIQIHKVGHLQMNQTLLFGDSPFIKSATSRELMRRVISGEAIQEDFDQLIDIIMRTNDKLPIVKFCDIIIHWPEVTVTNENGNSIRIYDLFAKVPLFGTGSIDNIKFIKSTFTKEQYTNGYIHSHISLLRPGKTTIKEWRVPCFGTSHINQTIMRLRDVRGLEKNEIEDEYMMFCVELNQFTQVESLAGGPYIQLERVKTGIKGGKYLLSGECIRIEKRNTAVTEPIKRVMELEEELTRRLIESNKLKWAFSKSVFCLGMSISEVTILATNMLIDILTDEDKNREELTMILFDDVCIIDNDLYYNYDSMVECIDETMLVFKGKEIKMKILGSQDIKPLKVITAKRLSNILDRILLNLNCFYGDTEIDEKRAAF